MPPPQSLRYARQIALPAWGESGQRSLANARLLLVGLGGLGCAAATYLVRAGVGTLVLNDFDRVDESNLARQILYTETDIGAAKTAAAARRLREANPSVDVETREGRLTPDELTQALSSCDLAIDTSDNFASRFALNAVCVQARKPLISGAALRFEGQLIVFRADLDGTPCYRCLYDEHSEEFGDCAGQGVFTPLVGVIGAALAGSALRILLGLATEEDTVLSCYDAATERWRQIRLHKDPNCPICRAS